MRVLLSWIRDFVDVPGTPEEIGARMSLRGLALEDLEPAGPGPLPHGRRHEGPDAVLDFEVTANRPDCLSMIGIAREIATAHALPLRLPGPSAEGILRTPNLDRSRARTRNADRRSPPAVESRLDRMGGSVKRGEVPVTIADPDLCARYAAAVVPVTMAPSPAWMQARLTACGIRPINNVVDITNYVLLEIGHPMHAFDLARLQGGVIVVRRARPDEEIETLDGKRHRLDSDMLVIADADRAVAVGGVMGGTQAEVSAATAHVLLESAWFSPQSVRRTSRRLGLRTEASYRFERGADLTAPVKAIARAAALLESTGAGRSPETVVDCYPHEHEPIELALEARTVSGLLGMEVPPGEVERILELLGFGVRALGGWQAAAPDAALPISRSGHGWRVTVPGWRVDVQRPVDLIEEIGRHHGFEHLPATFPAVEQAPPPADSRLARDGRVRRALLAMGFSEAVTFGFIDRPAAAPYLGEQEGVVLANPLSEKFTTLRPSLIPGLVDAVSHNRRHGRRDVRLFEIGTRFSPTGETRTAAAVWTGLATPDHWSGGRRDVDFFDIKGVAEQLCAVMNVAPSFELLARPYLVDGCSAEVRAGGLAVGLIGQLVPGVAESRDLPAGDAVYVLEFDLDRLATQPRSTDEFAKPLPRHPSVVRDISILVDETLPAGTVRDTIRAAGPSTLVGVREFDRYQRKGIPEGKVSLSLRLTFQAPDRTLTDAEVHSAMQNVVEALTREVRAIQR